MNADKRGFKRVCVECGSRFYDLTKRPIICPSCSAEFFIEEKIKPRVAEKKSAPKKKAVSQVTEATESTKDDDELEEEDDGVEVVSLEDLETVEKNSDDDDGEVKIDLDDDSLEDLDVDLDLDVGTSPDAETDEEA